MIKLVSGRAALLAVVTAMLAACQSNPQRADDDAGRVGMTVDEARSLAAGFKAETITPPPRSIADVRDMLGHAKQPPSNCTFERQWREEEAAEISKGVGQSLSYTVQGRWSNGVRVVQIAERLAGVGRIREAMSLLARGARDATLGEHPTGVPDAWNSDRMDEQFDAIFHQSKLIAYATHAQLRSVIGDAEGAAQSARAAQENLRGVDGWGNPEEMRLYVVLAQASAAQAAGRLAEAEAGYRDVITNGAWVGAVHGSINLAWAGSRLSANLLQQGRVFEAELAARRTMRNAFDAFRGTELASSVGMPAMQLGAALLAQNRLDDAEFLTRRSINFFEVDCAAPGSLTLALARRTLIAILAARGDWAAVAEEVRRARDALADDPESFRRIYGDDPEIWLASVHDGDSVRALTELRALAARLSRARGADDEAALEALGFVGLGLHASGDRDGALTAFRAATKPYRNGQRALGQPGVSGVTGRMRIVLDDYSTLLGELAVPPDARRAALVDEHFRIAQLLRLGRVQRAYGAAAARAAAGTPELAELVRRSQDAEQEMASIVEVLNFTAMSARGEVDPGLENGSRERLRTLRQARAVLEAEIARRFPSYSNLLRPRPMSIVETQRLLRKGEALLVYHVGRGNSWVWAIPESGAMTHAALGMGDGRLAARVARLRQGLDPSGAETLGDIKAFNVEAAHALFEAVLAPVASGWREAEHLLVVTDGALGQLPLGVLPVSAARSSDADASLLFAGYRNVDWLGSTRALSVLPAVAALATIDGPAAAPTVVASFAGFGNPVFTSRSAPALSASTRGPGGGPRFTVRMAPTTRTASSASLSDLPPLPETAEEVRAVAAALGAGEESMYLGARASEANIKGAALRDRRVILMATHGLVPGDIDGLGQPALAMSSPSVTGGGGDGLLTLEEVLALDLDADWVILSACNTGVADGRGAEAVSGLGRAFFYAGARALLVSNWPVHSAATRDLTTSMITIGMTGTGRPRAEAHRMAMAQMISQGTFRNQSGEAVFAYAHPVFWAPFSVVGDGR